MSETTTTASVTLVDCDCQVEAQLDGSVLEMRYCALHASAPDLYNALKLFMTCFPAAIMSLSDEQQQQIRAALAKATP